MQEGCDGMERNGTASSASHMTRDQASLALTWCTSGRVAWQLRWVVLRRVSHNSQQDIARFTSINCQPIHEPHCRHSPLLLAPWALLFPTRLPELSPLLRRLHASELSHALRISSIAACGPVFAVIFEDPR